MLEVENLIKFRLGGQYVCITGKNSIVQNMEADMRDEYRQLKDNWKSGATSRGPNDQRTVHLLPNPI